MGLKPGRFHVSLPALLGIALVILKFYDIIDWSWWIVTGPLWVVAAYVFTVDVAWPLIELAAGWHRHRR